MSQTGSEFQTSEAAVMAALNTTPYAAENCGARTWQMIQTTGVSFIVAQPNPEHVIRCALAAAYAVDFAKAPQQ